MVTRASFLDSRVLLVLIAISFILSACSGPESDDPTSASNPPTLAPSTPSNPPASPTGGTPIIPTVAVLSPSPETSTVTATVTGTATAKAIATSTATLEPTTTPTVAVTVTTAPEPTATSTPPTPDPTATAAPSVVAGADDVLTIRTADTDEMIVSLTFDAGADRGFAEDILDTLRDEGVVATFGMTGRWAEDNPDLVLRMVDEGHTLMNHTESHRSFTGFSTGDSPLTSAERAEELRVTEEVIEGIAGYTLRPYFRPPYGDYDDSVLGDLAANGYTVNVMWTVDSLGWRGLTAEEITQRVVDGTVPGAIHLFHVGAQSQDAAALPSVINELRSAGYEFVTIHAMVGR